ncbi:hypothetical protein ACN2MM_10385 [Alkalilimnicola ehrlichii MLHE-1]|nr:hypothetical protein [Alkalilimnicola ehrlichii]
MAKRPGAILGISDTRKWPLSALRDLAAQVEKELGQRAKAKAEAKKAARKNKRSAPEKNKEQGLAALEESLLKEIQEYERGRKAGVIRV